MQQHKISPQNARDDVLCHFSYVFVASIGCCDCRDMTTL